VSDVLEGAVCSVDECTPGIFSGAIRPDLMEAELCKMAGHVES
jgi:hypothetical protein